jgi:hypothetical protein
MNWTPEIDQYIRENYQSMTKKQMAEALGTTCRVLGWHTQKLGLKKYEHSGKHKTHNKQFPDSVRKNLGIN